MTSDEKLRWTAFIAASFFFHAAALAWLDLSGDDFGQAPSKLTVLLQNRGGDKASKVNELPASAVRSRDLFDRPTAPVKKSTPLAKREKKASVSAKAVNSSRRVNAEKGKKPASSLEAKTEAKSPAPARNAAETIETASTPRAAEVSEPAPSETRALESAERVFKSARLAAAADPASAPNGSRSSTAQRQGELLSLLHQAISSEKRYPLLAKRQRREGTTTVSFSLSPSGEMDAIGVDRSSGFSVLDTAAVSAVSRVAPFAPARIFLSDVTRFKVDVTFTLN